MCLHVWQVILALHLLLVHCPFSALQPHVLETHFLSCTLLSPFCVSTAASVHFLGSRGSKTVTQSSLVIGHGHANQTGRNLQLIRILPPAIIVPRHWPHRPPLHKINYILGSIPTIGFPVLELHYMEGGGSQDNTVSRLFQLQKEQLSCGKLRKQRQKPIHPSSHLDWEILAARNSHQSPRVLKNLFVTHIITHTCEYT